MKNIVTKLFGAVLIIWGLLAIFLFNVSELGKLFVMLEMVSGIITGKVYLKNTQPILIFLLYLIISFLSSLLFVESGIDFLQNKNNKARRFLFAFLLGLISIVLSYLFNYLQKV